MTVFHPARDILQAGIDTRAFPAAVIEVGRSREVLWREAFGTLSWEPDASRTRDDTIFDLASLTKAIATATLIMRLLEAGRATLDDRVARRLAAWTGADRDDVTLRDLLAHCSGLTAWLPLFHDYRGRVEFERAICTLPLEYRPRTRALYSDFGFMLLGFIIADLGEAPLAAQFDQLVAAVLDQRDELTFAPPAAWRTRTAPTEVDPWRGRLLIGEVHDENAWALGGAAGHSGLFGSAGAVGRFARTVLNALIGPAEPGREPLARRETVRTFLSRTDIPGSSRALGWDTMLPTSSCGPRMSPSSFGHTGFTGTSLWIDPEGDVYVVLLTNRVHPTRANEAIHRIRPRLHDAIMEGLARRP